MSCASSNLHLPQHFASQTEFRALSMNETLISAALERLRVCIATAFRQPDLPAAANFTDAMLMAEVDPRASLGLGVICHAAARRAVEWMRQR